MIPKPKPKPKKKKKYISRVLKYWKKPKTKLQRFENEVWDAQSRMVRLRDKKCVTCSSTDNPQQGHLISARFTATRYDWVNVHQQCGGCNKSHCYSERRYTQWFLNRYGQDAYDSLVERSYPIKKFSMQELENLKMGFELLIDSLKKIPDPSDPGDPHDSGTHRPD
jgi:hypothetical protein